MTKSTKAIKKPVKKGKERIERETIKGHDFVTIYVGDKVVEMLTAQEFEIQEAKK